MAHGSPGGSCRALITLTQVVGKSTRRDVLLDLVLRNKRGLAGEAMAEGRLDCRVHEMVEFRTPHRRSMEASRIIALRLQEK